MHIVYTAMMIHQWHCTSYGTTDYKLVQQRADRIDHDSPTRATPGLQSLVHCRVLERKLAVMLALEDKLIRVIIRTLYALAHQDGAPNQT